MRYSICCPNCGDKCLMDLEAKPSFCMFCRSPIEVEEVKTQARLTAEAKMAELDEIAPRLLAAQEAYFKVRVEYEDRLQFLAQYRKRGHITNEEYDRYRMRSQNFLKDLNRAVAAYRNSRKENKNG